ncbi:tyrosine-type recombinase/integrase [Nocardioides sp. HB32]
MAVGDVRRRPPARRKARSADEGRSAPLRLRGQRHRDPHVTAHGTTGKNRWLFAGEGDEPPHQNTVGYWWRKTLRDAGLSGIKLHNLRHFYASGLIAAGCDVVTVQRSLGHAKATTTLNTYAHLWPTAEDRTRKAAESIMSSSLGQQGTGAARRLGP